MTYLDLAQPWLEWEAELIAEEQHNCYINGQNDALTLTKPQEPHNSCYMEGWEDTMKKMSDPGEVSSPWECAITTGEIKPELINSNESIYTADEEF